MHYESKVYRAILGPMALVCLLSLASTGCAIAGGWNLGVAATPAALNEVSTYQVKGRVELGIDDNDGFMLLQEARLGLGSFGLFVGLRFPRYFQWNEHTLYLSPALGVDMDYDLWRDESAGGIALRVGAGLARRQRKRQTFVQSLFSWHYDTRTVGLEVSQVLLGWTDSGGIFPPTTVAVTVGRVF